MYKSASAKNIAASIVRSPSANMGSMVKRNINNNKHLIKANTPRLVRVKSEIDNNKIMENAKYGMGKYKNEKIIVNSDFPNKDNEKVDNKMLDLNKIDWLGEAEKAMNRAEEVKDTVEFLLENLIGG